MRSIVAFPLGMLAAAGLVAVALAAPVAIGDDCAPGAPGAPGAPKGAMASAAAPAGEKAGPTPEHEPKITAPFLTTLAGDWSCDCAYPTGGHAMGDAHAKLILDDTAVQSDITMNWKGKDGKEETIHNMGIWKVNRDGKSVSFWGFSSHDATADLLTGELTDDSVTVGGQTRWGPMRLTLTLKDGGLEQHLWIDHHDMGKVAFKKK